MYCVCCNVQLCGFFIVFAFVAGISPEKSGFIPIVVVVGYRFWRLLFWFWIEYLSFLTKFGCLGDDEKGNAVRIFADFRSPDAVDGARDTRSVDGCPARRPMAGVGR